MVKRQRKGFWARLLSLVVVVLILAAAPILRDGRILGHDLREAHEAKALKNDTLEVTPDGAFVVNTKPLAKDVQGYGGPVPLKDRMLESTTLKRFETMSSLRKAKKRPNENEDLAC